MIYQLVDACLFTVAFLLSCTLRSNPNIIEWLKLGPVSPFENFAWLYLVLIPTAPFILESQGFYNHPPLCQRGAILWPLLKGCVFITLELALTAYVFHLIVAPAILVFVRLHWFQHVVFEGRIDPFPAQKQSRPVTIQAAVYSHQQERETATIRRELEERANEGVEIVTELNLLEIP